MIILAGGFGTRLKSILNGLPKPLASINGTPFLKYLFQNWIDKGFSKFFLSLHYESDKIIQFVNDNRKILFKNCEINFFVEPYPMGTGGAVSYLLSKIKLEGDIFIVNADTWVENGYLDLNTFDKDVIAVVDIENTNRFGTVVLSKDDNILEFKEKHEKNEPGLINAGVYKLNCKYFNNWDGHPYSIENDLFPELVKAKKLYGKKIKSNFIDIGIPEDFENFCKLKRNEY